MRFITIARKLTAAQVPVAITKMDPFGYIGLTGVHGEVITYAVVGAMNGYEAIPGADGQVLRNRMQIRRPGQGAVFPDEGRLSPASWTVWYDQKRW